MKVPSLFRMVRTARFMRVALVLFLYGLSGEVAHSQDGRNPESKKNRPTAVASSLIVQDLDSGLTPTDLAQSLVGPGVTISNITYVGANTAAGSFSGGDGVVGFTGGILLTSGAAGNVVGPNVSDSISQDNGLPGDADLTSLSGFPTFDATILEFDFVPVEDTVFFRFVFASDEYNEFANRNFNDVFAFYVNGTNCATVEGLPVSINTINYGNPFTTLPYSHPELYINNDINDGGGAIDTEMDGLTNILTCVAAVNAGQQNHMKLAIADATDHIYDAAVFLEAASLTSASIIELIGLEVTQAIQNLTNDAELVDGKTTFVRAHVRSASGTTVFNVKGKLIGRRGGAPLSSSPLAPLNLGGNIDVLGSPARVQLNQSFYFRLPPSWTNGSVELEFVGISHQVNCLEAASVANDCKAAVSFLDTPALKVSLIGVQWEDAGGTLHDPGDTDYTAVVQNMSAQLPIPNLDWNTPNELADWVDDGGPPDSDIAGQWDLGDVILHLRNQRNLDGITDRVYYGLLIDYPSGADLGLGYTPGWASAGFHRATDPTTAAHEVGHNLNRQHITCTGSEANVDAGYPYADGHISNVDTGNDAYFGFHIGTQQIFPPNTGDLLGYCRPRWVSDYTYERMRSYIDTTWSASLRTQGLAAQGDPAVLVSGFINLTTGAGSFATVLQVPAPGTIVLPEPGDYTIRFEDAGGAELASYSFAPDIPADIDEADALFSLLLPWNATTARIVLLHGTEELAASTASNNPPLVTITDPVAGVLWDSDSEVVSWNASDADGDELTFAVQYSADDGVTWATLTTGHSGNSYVVNRTLLAGSDTARVRVLASDGFHTASALSGVISVVKNAPEVQIAAPSFGALFVEDQPVFFEGSASDTEDGEPDPGNLIWSSDLDGVLGAGKVLVTNALSMTVGLHTITLQATDSDGQSASTTTTLQIFRNRPTLAPQLAVAPSGLQFQRIAGSGPSEGQMVSVANLGDGAIAWTASASEPWLNLSTTTGFTPDIITATVDASALASGEYTGTITVTDTATPASPHGVQIVLTVYELADAVMEATPTSGVAPLTVDFTNQSTGSYNNIAWDFGDGATSTTANTSHTYNQPGVFTANLTISGGLGGTDTISQQIEIFAPVAAVFGAVPTSGVAPLAVAFTNQSSGDFDSCSWDFGDNQTSNQCTGGTHTYTTAGDYTVTLTVSGLGGTDTTTRTVTVSEQPGADARKLSLPLIRR